MGPANIEGFITKIVGVKHIGLYHIMFHKKELLEKHVEFIHLVVIRLQIGVAH